LTFLAGFAAHRFRALDELKSETGEKVLQGDEVKV
jgi:hypothetical protein